MTEQMNGWHALQSCRQVLSKQQCKTSCCPASVSPAGLGNGEHAAYVAVATMESTTGCKQ